MLTITTTCIHLNQESKKIIPEIPESSNSHFKRVFTKRKLIQGHSGSKIRKKAENGKLKLNGLHRDHPPAWKLISKVFKLIKNFRR